MLQILHSRHAPIAIDLGSANLRIATPDRGLVFDEPAICCFDRNTDMSRLFAAGDASDRIEGRAPIGLQTRRPLSRGVLQDIECTTLLLRYALDKAGIGRTRARQRAYVGVPGDATQAERNALLTALSDAGILSARLVDEPFAAAGGAGLPVDAAGSSMVIDCGAGITEVGIFSLGGSCVTQSIRLGGTALAHAIIDELHLTDKFLIGEPSAERLMRDFSRSAASEASPECAVRGRCLRSGLPAELRLDADRIQSVISHHVQRIAAMVARALGRVPPDLCEDLLGRGALLTGGAALMPAMAEAISRETGLSVVSADEPALCVVRGLALLAARSSGGFE